MHTFRKSLWAWVLAIVPVLAFAAEPTVQTLAPPSLCRVEEQILFTCGLPRSAKVISLCGSKSLDNRRGYLQYRFGKAGAMDLQFPRERANTQMAFRYAHYFRAQVDRTEVTFDNGDYRYVLFDYYEGDTKPAIKESGIRIRRHGSGEKETEMKCPGNAISNLTRLAAVVSRDNDNPLNQ